MRVRPDGNIDDWMVLSEVANLYGKSVSATRSELKAELDGVPRDKIDSLFKQGKGRRGAFYHRDFVKRTLGLVPTVQLTDGQRNVFGKQGSVSTVRVSGADEEALLCGALTSRTKANSAYFTLVTEMISIGAGLRIRCITGTDFFNAHHATGDAFYRRVKKGVGVAKVLLTFPFERAAQIRSAVEGEANLAMSQFSRDARSTFEFIRAGNKLRLESKWAEDLPPSLLIWTEQYALVEPYDHGRQDKDRPGCIGRKAPILVVNGGTVYHGILRNGFDYIFDGTSTETHVRTYSLKEIAREYRKQPG